MEHMHLRLQFMESQAKNSWNLSEQEKKEKLLCNANHM
jgi:hypothetical protein